MAREPRDIFVGQFRGSIEAQSPSCFFLSKLANLDDTFIDWKVLDFRSLGRSERFQPFVIANQHGHQSLAIRMGGQVTMKCSQPDLFGLAQPLESFTLLT